MSGLCCEIPLRFFPECLPGFRIMRHVFQGGCSLLKSASTILHRTTIAILRLKPEAIGTLVGAERLKTMQHAKRSAGNWFGLLWTGLIFTAAASLRAQSPPSSGSGGAPEPLNWTAQQDHQDMM